jgi:tyrosinase
LAQPPATQSTIAATAAGQFWDWTAHIKVNKFEIGTSFSILFFLGSVPENPKEYINSPNLVGAHHEFVNNSSERCANCKVQVQEGFVHLDGGILELGNLFPFDSALPEKGIAMESCEGSSIHF